MRHLIDGWQRLVLFLRAVTIKTKTGKCTHARHTDAHCKTLQRTATHCNALNRSIFCSEPYNCRLFAAIGKCGSSFQNDYYTRHVVAANTCVFVCV